MDEKQALLVFFEADMKSPFPGMDPYLEPHWLDIHTRLIPLIGDQLEEFLPKALVVRFEERIVFEIEGEDHDRHPDVRVVERTNVATERASRKAALAEANGYDSCIVQIDNEPFTETFLEIVDVNGGNVVTVLELLSPTNKFPGEGLNQYRKKQEELRRGSVSLIEIDLLRSGRRGLVMPVRKFPRKFRTTYNACVRRGWTPGEVEIFSMPLQKPLPKIKIPLREKDKEICLDLQPLLEHAYRKGRYADTIDYRQPCDPPLEGEEAKWSDELLKAAGKR